VQAPEGAQVQGTNQPSLAAATTTLAMVMGLC